MVKEKHDYPIVLTVKHVQEIMGCGKTSAYEFVNIVSAHMKKQGKIPPKETVGKTSAYEFVNIVSAHMKKQGKIPPKETVGRAVVPRDVFFELYGI